MQNACGPLRPSCRRSHTCRGGHGDEPHRFKAASDKSDVVSQTSTVGQFMLRLLQKSLVTVKWSPTGKRKKKSVLKHTLLSSSIVDRTHKRAICQIPYAQKGRGKGFY